ncbi:MAG: decaprenyl-phosphate phosphoribosyltransferase [Anaerolineales bacterium]|nr:MAG: decaprenyl-phosphate phosphoribosyltransferase [Anaerolineales bacterium]
MLIALFKNMRPKQWAKNVLLFAGLVFDRQLTQLGPLKQTVLGFVFFCLLSSSVYLINDILDVEADRRHPRKKHRPLASGALPVWLAASAAAVFMLVALVGGFWLSPVFGMICVVYLALNFTYSSWFKHIAIIDVIVLAMFYVLRVGAGVALIDVVRFSPWLYVFTTFFALFLGIGKRRAEIKAKGSARTRKVLAGYTENFLDQLLLIVLSLAILTYSLYTFSAPNLPENHSMMLTIPFVLYGFFRYLYLVQVKDSGEAPEDILFADRPLQIDLVLWAVTILLIFYFS